MINYLNSTLLKQAVKHSLILARISEAFTITILGIFWQQGILAIPQNKRQRGQYGGVQHPQQGQYVRPVHRAVPRGETTHTLPTQRPHLSTCPGVWEQHTRQRQAEACATNTCR